ncbi:MAG: PaaI family thioesterase [Oligoflexia bacterium]|nr:PaaI family thioesterase [Oligoflexia bacterium]MBF0364279.1 PaaI family thioesterase [Oligoflexia bacterium]
MPLKKYNQRQEQALTYLNQNYASKGALQYLKLRFIAISDTELTATMEVGKEHTRPGGALHGGVSALLAESVASVASALVIEDLAKESPVGLELNINHIRPLIVGDHAYATASACHIGKSTHIFEIKLTNQKQELFAIARLTLFILKAEK